MSMRIIISDKMSPDGLAYFTGREGCEVVYDPEITMEDLAKRLPEFDALVIRSRTTVTREMLEKPGKLRIIGRAGAGVDNVDVEAATEKGIVVMNTPGGNTISTAEHAISMMLSVARRIPFADKTMHEGKWAKKSIVGTEMYEKTLGILGLGKIGRVVAERMKAFGMNILGFDPFMTQEAAAQLGVELADVDTICERADVMTVHCPLNDKTRGLIGAEQFAKMKPGMLIVNCARGGIIDEDALFEALKQNRIAGAAVDVFETEPLPEDHKLRGLENAVLTPHLAATTAEAQEKVALQLAEQIFEALSGGVIRNAINAPSVDANTFRLIQPVLELCERLGLFVSQFAPPAVKELEITYSGTKAQHPQQPLTTALVKGFMQKHVSESVNEVNALLLARQLGLKIKESRTEESGDIYAGLVSVRTVSDNGEEHTVCGTLNEVGAPRVVLIDNKAVETEPVGDMLMVENRDRPGIIGSVGTVLGEHGVNIASMNWGRTAPGADALMIINVDTPIDDTTLEKIRGVKDVISATRITI